MQYRVFKNPQNGHVVRVKQGFNWWVFLFGPLWYLFNDMIGQGIGWLIAAIIAGSFTYGLGVFIVWFIAASGASNARCNYLLSRGYIEITDDANQN